MKVEIKETRFESGLTIITDRMRGVRSATLGFFFRKGSRHEPDELNGISHFIEHTVFKGTRRRSARDIAVETDRLGGNLDAFTTHEETGFAIKVIDDQFENAFDLLADMLVNPAFDEKELKSEQRVIIEEIKMIEDSPEEYLGDLFSEALFPGHPLGLSIAGTPKTVKSFNGSVTSGYHQGAFGAGNLVIVAAGNVEHGRIIDLVVKHFGSVPVSRSAAAANSVNAPEIAAPILIKKNRNLEQAHLILASPFVSARERSRYAGDLLANIIGGGTSSRLWQKVREERGLAYSVGSSAVMFHDCGFFSIYAGTSPKQTEEVLDIAVEEMRCVVRGGVTPEELDLAKQQTIASILLGLEDSAARAATLAHSEMLHGRQIPIDETLSNIDAVTVEEVQSIAREYFRTEKMAFAALGNLNGMKIERERLDVE